MEAELEEVLDIEDTIPNDETHPEEQELVNSYPISFDNRLEAFEKEWVEFVKKQITKNITPYFNLWFGMKANRIFLIKMEKLAKKHFRGILKEESLTRLQIYVKHLQYGISGLIAATHSSELEPILKFVERFTSESFEAMEHWNWPLAHQNMDRLKPYRPEDSIDDDDEWIDKESEQTECVIS
jgi:hypothetical protein